jgi:pilus assembly protein CpaE
MRSRRVARGAASVVVVGVDAIGMGLIRECLGTEAVLPTSATPYEEAGQVVRKTRPNVVVMGFDIDFDEAVRLGQSLQAESSSLHMVAISSRTDPERIRAAMRAGYREYVVLPEDADLLRRAVHESAYAEDDEGEQGDLIAMVGSKGGCGVSFLTVNIAAELSAIERVAVLDLDFSMGDIAAFLDLEPTNSVHDVLRDLDRLDERMLAGSVTVHPSKVHVLAQPTELVNHEEIHGEDIMRILSTAADTYQYILADCGGRIDVATLTTTSVADRIILVTTPDVVSVRNAWRRLQLMDRIGVDRDSIRLVVNKWGRNAELRIEDIEKNLQAKVAATISRDDSSCGQAVNRGRLLRDIAPRSPVLKDIAATLEIITEGAEAVEPTTNKSFWGGLFGG